MRATTILSYVDAGPGDDARLRAAIDLSLATGATLFVLCVAYASPASNVATDPQGRLAALEAARRLARETDRHLQEQGICVDALPFVALPEAFDNLCGALGRYVDFVVKDGSSHRTGQLVESLHTMLEVV